MKCFTEERKRERERGRERETRIVPRYAITMKYYSTRIFGNIRGSYEKREHSRKMCEPKSDILKKNIYIYIYI